MKKDREQVPPEKLFQTLRKYGNVKEAKKFMKKTIKKMNEKGEIKEANGLERIMNNSL